MKDQPVVKVMVKPIIQNNKQDKESISKKEEENRESFKIKSPPNPKVTNQEKNINDNYRGIYNQKGQRKNPNYVKDQETELKYQGFQNNNSSKTNIYNNKLNNDYDNNKYSDHIDINELIFGKDQEYGKSKNNNLIRKSIDRGENKNIKITHIIYTSMETDFNIIEPLEVTTEESRRKYKGSIDKKNRNGKNGSVRVTYSCSCKNVKILPKNKNKNPGTSEVVAHRDNPHLKGYDNNINNIKTSNNNKINRGNNNTKVSNEKISYSVNKNLRKKY